MYSSFRIILSVCAVVCSIQSHSTPVKWKVTATYNHNVYIDKRIKDEYQPTLDLSRDKNLNRKNEFAVGLYSLSASSRGKLGEMLVNCFYNEQNKDPNNIVYHIGVNPHIKNALAGFDRTSVHQLVNKITPTDKRNNQTFYFDFEKYSDDNPKSEYSFYGQVTGHDLNRRKELYLDQPKPVCKPRDRYIKYMYAEFHHNVKYPSPFSSGDFHPETNAYLNENYPQPSYRLQFKVIPEEVLGGTFVMTTISKEEFNENHYQEGDYTTAINPDGSVIPFATGVVASIVKRVLGKHIKNPGTRNQKYYLDVSNFHYKQRDNEEMGPGYIKGTPEPTH